MKLLAVVLIIGSLFIVPSAYATGSDKTLAPKSVLSQHIETRPCSNVSMNSLACIEAILNNDGGSGDGAAIDALVDRVGDKALEHPCLIKARNEGRVIDLEAVVKYHQSVLHLEVVAKSRCE